MTEPASVVSAWQSFFVIVGSSAAALIGLQFVVITLIADRRLSSTMGAVNAFSTPTVVHLAGALLVSAIMSAPWRTLDPPAIALLVSGIAGLVYCVVVFRRARRQDEYEPVGEDWFWYVVLPSVLYAVLTVSAVRLRAGSESALFGVGGSALSLLLLGIRNAWDTVTHIVTTKPQDDASRKETK
jgi:hypothetical protein